MQFQINLCDFFLQLNICEDDWFESITHYPFFLIIYYYFFSTFSEKKIIKFLSILLYFDFQFQKKK